MPSHTVHGIEGQPLQLTVDYNFNATASEIQIIWLFERPQSNPKYLLGSVNQTVVPDLEYQHKFTLIPPSASLTINPLHLSDEGNYIVKVNIRGNGTTAASQKIQVAVDGELGEWRIFIWKTKWQWFWSTVWLSSLIRLEEARFR